MRKHFKGESAALAGMSDADILTKVLRQSFRPQQFLRDRILEFEMERFRRPVIGLHVRYMDRKACLRDFIKHVDRVIAKIPRAQIFLATDNTASQDSILQRYGDATVITTQKWFPSKGVSMHQNPACPDRFQHAVDALVDMYLLAKCDWLIYPGSSTFSYISSLLSESSINQIIDIERFNIRVRTKRFIRSLIA